MAFMRAGIEGPDTWVLVEGPEGEVWTTEDMLEEGEEPLERHEGWYGGNFSASGHMDQTEYTVGETKAEVAAALLEEMDVYHFGEFDPDDPAARREALEDGMTDEETLEDYDWLKSIVVEGGGKKSNASKEKWRVEVDELRGPGIPLYLPMLVAPDDTVYRYRRSFKDYEEALRTARAFVGKLNDPHTSVLLHFDWRVSEGEKRNNAKNAKRARRRNNGENPRRPWGPWILFEELGDQRRVRTNGEIIEVGISRGGNFGRPRAWKPLSFGVGVDSTDTADRAAIRALKQAGEL